MEAHRLDRGGYNGHIVQFSVIIYRIFITQSMAHSAACHLPSNKSGEFFPRAGIAESEEHVLDLPSRFKFLSKYLDEHHIDLQEFVPLGKNNYEPYAHAPRSIRKTHSRTCISSQYHIS